MARKDEGPDSAEAEETVVVDREAEAETLLVERTTARGAAGAGSADSGGENEGTLAVTRQRASSAAPNVPSTGRRRRGMTMPPVPPRNGRGAVDAVGPGAVATYQPREMPDLATAGLEFGGVEATRVDSTPCRASSVAHAARAWSLSRSSRHPVWSRSAG